jgi:hypothetical protein
MENKSLLAGGAIIVILVVAAASFTAGLFFGQRGYVAGLQMQTQNGQPPQGGFQPGTAPQSGPNAGQPSQNGLNPAGGPPNAPSWPPDVMGRLVSIAATQLVLDTPNGVVTVALNSSTLYLGPDGQPADVGSFQPGDVVAVFGQGAATSIMELPPRPNGQGGQQPSP